eukprot:CAMPEP_0119125976 /NCGR_PEP_ID=MMETSP1310-20130426/5062_1 /TAXON_ID=464262 /ORGANISM="Genus nov. species nov., Strain RCC2339" /LENGTH=1513 /DNA_ID=CAMNT_0007116097 /DNA_START=47 /DNA_END=4588 /DNA_ORIENTATION=+
MAALQHPACFAKLSLHRRGGPSRFVHAFFVILYALSLYQCYLTLGEPYEEALASREEIEWGASDVGESGDDEEVEKVEDIWGGDEEDDWLGEESGGDGEELFTKESGEEGNEGAEIVDDDMWDDLDDEGWDDLRFDLMEVEELLEEPLPSAYLPSFFPSLFFLAVLFFHVLFIMCCYWSVQFRCLMAYSATTTVDLGVFVRATPHRHKGASAIVPIQKSEVDQSLFFMFQRQRFDVFVEEDESVVVENVQCPTDLPIKDYIQGPLGLSEGAAVEVARDRFGLNSFAIPTPSFWDLYSAQLMSPIAAFQFFCSILWLLDEYWKYTMFTMFMILVFEATTAFTRLKNLKTLGGMGSTPYAVCVYRGGAWQQLLYTEVLPGDIVSLVSSRKTDDTEDSESIVPCDCLLLRGTAVLNESSLTGESIPQLKDPIGASADDEDELRQRLDMFGKDKTHVLFSGTHLMQQTAEGSGENQIPVPRPPDGGCVAYVLRTGFNSSQGELMRMIECSTQRVSGNMKETALLLSMLLCFALMASGYVFWKGLLDGKRSKYSLLLRCTQIITSVVPADLPMQTGLAVNTALMSLLKAQIYCTEPYRVPLAGKITDCFFDKTGTLTTDHLEAMGAVFAVGQRVVRESGGSSAGAASETALQGLQTSPLALQSVIAGCHALVEVGGKLVGDPVDVAAMKEVDWKYDPAAEVASNEETLAGGLVASAGKRTPAPPPATVRLRVYHRHRFASALQRMSAVVALTTRGARGGKYGGEVLDSGAYVLLKGSPEAVLQRVAVAAGSSGKGKGKSAGAWGDAEAGWYNTTYKALSGSGMRIIAYAWKRISPEEVGLAAGESNWDKVAAAAAQRPRDWAESDVTFAGFIGFACRVRKDSKAVVRSLKESGQNVVMITGDAALTAFHVSKQVAISPPNREGLLLVLRDEEDASQSLSWLEISSASTTTPTYRPFAPSEVNSLARECTLVVTGPAFDAALEQAPSFWDAVLHIAVFARMSPEGKERIVKKLKEMKRQVLMCGDGGNDVGALKQAHVGLALLSGFGNANALSPDELKKEGEDEQSGEDELKKFEAETEKKLKEAMEKQKKEKALKAKKMKEGFYEKQKRYLEEEIERRERNGETGVMSKMQAMQAAISRVKKEVQEDQASERSKMISKHGGAVGASAAQMSKAFDDMEDGEVPMVKPGDASIAAPFTSKMPSIRSVANIIRQGRCTLVSTVQQQQILVLNCLITAYSLSALSLEGARNSEYQLIATGLTLVVASMAFTFAKPLDRLSNVHPLPTVFHPASIISVFGQLAIHLACMVYAVRMSKDAMGETELKALLNFQKEAARRYKMTGNEEFLSKHKPNLLNTVIFLVETAQQVSVMAVNYKGRPWTKSLSENTALLWSLFATLVGVCLCAWEVVPELNKLLGLVALPGDDFRVEVIVLLLLSTAGTLIWDRLCLFTFARPVWHASWRESQFDVKAIWGGAKMILLGLGALALIVFLNLDLLSLLLIYGAYRFVRSKMGNSQAAPAS